METIKNAVRSVMRYLAGLLNKLSAGKITANGITITSVIMHLPIAWLIASGRLTTAGILLIVFGLFDTLDGELARLQRKTSAFGMFLDSATDRIKELMIYVGIAAWFIASEVNGEYLVLLVGALGVSLITTYLNAWGEAVLAHSQPGSKHKVNATFRGGVLGFEIRMTIIVLGTLADRLEFSVVAILILGSLTIIQRLASILTRLKNV